MPSLATLFKPRTAPPPIAVAAAPAISLERHFVSLIHAAKSLRHLGAVHARLLRRGLFESSRVVTQLISTACHPPLRYPDYALAVFRHFPSQPNTFLFNALIRALSDSALHSASVSHYTLMRRLGVNPDSLTLPFALKSAASLPAPRLAGALHCDAAKLGLEMNSFVRTSLADMYVKLESFRLAVKLFDETPEIHKQSNVLLWNVVINGCCRAGLLKIARELFDAVPEQSLAAWSSMINGFMKNGDVEGATTFFERMPERNVVSWTTMISGLSQNGKDDEALAMFNRMLDADVRPNDFTVVSALIACARMGALQAGVRIHEYAKKNGFRINRQIGAALVDMYSKCGKIDIASQVFDGIEDRDLLTWTAVISGCAVHGRWKQALKQFDDMVATGIEPDGIVFLSLLMACSHSGRIDQGLELFDKMRNLYRIEPTLKHYTCVVDLYGRAGRLQEALDFIETMPLEADYVTWGALFSACRSHRNVKMGKLVSERLQKCKPMHHGSHVFLSNIFAATGRWEDAEKVRNDMRDRDISKEPGWSCIEMGESMHTFVAGDQSHPSSLDIYRKLEELVTSAREQGYKPNTEWVLHNIEEEEKEDALGNHSEKLALAFGLISTPDGADIKIVKNLRVCGDCHSMMKFASKICNREIVLRDVKRFHHFKDGVCSCGDYW